MKVLCVISLVLIFFLACKKEQPALSKTDCDCAKEVSADFVIEEIYAYGYEWEKRTETDACFGDRNVSFKALEENADYTWRIGSEVLKTKELVRYFSNSLIGQKIPVTLIVKKKANNICFPKDYGYDSKTKYITIVQVVDNDGPSTDSTFIEGLYRLKSPLLSDSIDMIVDYRYQGAGYNGVRINIYNYDGMGKNCIDIISRDQFTYRQFWTYGSTSITQGDYLQGDFKVKLNGLVEANFTTGGYVDGVYNQKLVDWKYKGRKL